MRARTLPHAGPATIVSPTRKRPGLDDHRRHGAAPDVEVRLEHDAAGRRLRAGLQLENFGEHGDLVEKVLDAEPLQRRSLDGDRVTAPGLGHEALLGELLEDAVGVRPLLVDLVERHDDRDPGRLGVVDRLDRLGHDAVVGGDDEHDDVGHLGAAGPHRGECFVAGRVDEGDPLAVPLDLVGADVLGDAARLGLDDIRLADPVEKQRLAVVDVPHHRHDRWPAAQHRRVDLGRLVGEEAGLQGGLLLLARVDEGDPSPDLGGEQLDHVVGERLRRRHDLALEEEEPDDVTGRAVELRPDLLGGAAPLDDDLVVRDGRVRGHVRRDLDRLELLHVATPALGPPLGSTRPASRSAPRAAGRRSAGSGRAALAEPSAGTAAVTTGASTAKTGARRAARGRPGAEAAAAGST